MVLGRQGLPLVSAPLVGAVAVGVALASAGCELGLLWVRRQGLLLLATKDSHDLNLKGLVGVRRQGLLLLRHP